MSGYDGKYVFILDEELEAHPDHWPLRGVAESCEELESRVALCSGGNPETVPRSLCEATRIGPLPCEEPDSGRTRPGACYRLECSEADDG